MKIVIQIKFDIKYFYKTCIEYIHKNDFPNALSYNRFVELSQQVILPMTMFLKMQCLGDCTGITYVDSTPIRVCKNKRIKRCHSRMLQRSSPLGLAGIQK